MKLLQTSRILFSTLNKGKSIPQTCVPACVCVCACAFVEARFWHLLSSSCHFPPQHLLVSRPGAQLSPRLGEAPGISLCLLLPRTGITDMQMSLVFHRGPGDISLNPHVYQVTSQVSRSLYFATFPLPAQSQRDIQYSLKNWLSATSSYVPFPSDLFSASPARSGGKTQVDSVAVTPEFSLYSEETKS